MNTKFELHWFGPQPASQLVIFVHGFAVNWTSKRLFTDLAEFLADKGITSVLFDLSDYDKSGNATYLNLNDQQDRLNQVYKSVRQASPTAAIKLVAHSLGCGLVASVRADWLMDLQSVLLLAPASNRPGPSIKQHILDRPGTITDGDKISFVRANGLNNNFDQAYVNQLDIDLDELYQKQWPQLTNLAIILAASDRYQASTQQLFKDNKAQTLADSDHNFTGKYRSQILAKAYQALRLD